MKYTVVIVEDEKYTLEALVRTTPWEQLDLELIGTAEDGMSGEELIKDMEPDIVITDIRLPGQDGLDMLSHSPVNHAIILSGYIDYAYMKKAIRLGVFDYLQKPMEEGQLESTLTELVKKLTEEESEFARFRKVQDASNLFIALPSAAGKHVPDAAIRFIEENYQSPIGLPEAARFAGVTESHLSRTFKEATDINFLQYLNAFRLNNAIRLMRNPGKNIGEIASESGFPTPGYFAKLFKKYTGKTPSQFRDEQSQIS
ncbi:response regulator transcription factor [Parasphaerochaeta coccoides]|uniref:Two component transcriptional regulator, AraC family n=1 Tax=Parasphaerochaeta coccoides (strain ATCC BAA-1237 / DSM 17374 / SPN1) TaxID=760011 RepID=F4GJZ0_PARC1|nr:helix-turn-helix domain-containing protein [Parasphaerochaeta coccoides]AEC01415.1 two component transcriptional regulator, AraC family [Parasphaerochaeta coccoides DSM 17374]